MVRLVFRVLSLLALCSGVVLAVVDSIASVSASQTILTSSGTALAQINAGWVPALQGLVESRVGTGAWITIRDVVLPQPAFAMLFALALLFWMAGYKKPSPAGRFAA